MASDTPAMLETLPRKRRRCGFTGPRLARRAHGLSGLGPDTRRTSPDVSRRNYPYLHQPEELLCKPMFDLAANVMPLVPAAGGARR